MDSLTFQNDSCYYQGKLYSGKGFRRKSLEFTYKKGLKHGKFQQWHSNGQLFVKSKYKKNEQHGKYKSWNKEGVLTAEIPFKNGDVYGTQKSFFDNGKPHEFTSFKPSDSAQIYFHGIQKSWNKDGVLTKSCVWVENKLQGKYTTRYDNGQVEIETTYDNGRLHGKYMHYHENGKLKIEAELDHGMEFGITKKYREEGYLYNKIDHDTDSAYYYYEDGKLNGCGKSINGIQEGTWIWYYSNGSKIVTLKYENGIRVGESTFYTEDGEKDRLVKWVDNKEVLIEDYKD